MTSEWTSKYNPFNSDKLLKHIGIWSKIIRGEKLPAPITVSIDPFNGCDLKCTFCNAHYRMAKNQGKLERSTLYELTEKLPRWGVRTVCVGGGGESLLNKYSGEFITNAYNNGLGVGIVTNGTQIPKNLPDLINCTWVGVSVDAGTSDVYRKIKGRNYFNKIVKNIEKLTAASEKSGTELGKKGSGHGVSYKYLMTPQNIGDIYIAAQRAKEIGCRNMHIRPGSPSWNKLNDSSFNFNPSDLELFKENIEKARGLENDNFRVFGVTHKFDGNLKVVHEFDNCHAVFMNGIIMPPSKRKSSFDWGMCCDRRGDDSLTLKGLDSLEDVKDFWGSEKHWEIYDNINIKTCPRCTFKPHNEIFENVIKTDNMSADFI